VSRRKTSVRKSEGLLWALGFQQPVEENFEHKNFLYSKAETLKEHNIAYNKSFIITQS
jgi:hypothetical protein